ncbi:haloacid dehalogenase type II [Bradyrhizobium sp. LHD-71]|uniref:haloacid dehalogenase type II n=1 Tax=Bradyrhizobium sp. LHD-71 TaxID=3072141 RepID=UPI00280DA0CB|nr:haloacid dehalogenase type II [Bradyrhizobium sp. LHD-71]MDQ8726902.1 haloacid dehalogenase type II [Bradyrhizobium sp. LHD-71]
MTIKAVVFDAYGTLYDIQSVASVTEQAFPAYGEVITQIWRMKQLEYTWLRSLMQRYADFSTVTRESLAYTLEALGLSHDASTFEKIMDKYLHLDPYPDAKATLAALKESKRAILSNGSRNMLAALVQNSGMVPLLDAVLSVDDAQVFKPSPKTYALVEQALGAGPDEVVFVSSNPFDASGAKAFGFKVAWIERVTGAALADETRDPRAISPLAMFKATRLRPDPFGFDPDWTIGTLSELPSLLAGLRMQ